MTRRLVLLRHAKAEPTGRSDRDRALALVGRRQAGEVGVALRQADLVPDLVLVSAALRTRQTWDVLRAGLGTCTPDIRVSEDLYDAGTGEVLTLIREVATTVKTVLVVGHEPTMSGLAAALAGPISDPGVLSRVRLGVPTAAWTALDIDGDWSDLVRGTAVLRLLSTPLR